MKRLPRRLRASLSAILVLGCLSLSDPRLAHAESSWQPRHIVICKIVDVYDPDSVTGECQLWFDVHSTESLRLAGVDTPERGWRAKCDEERALEEQGRAFVTDRIFGKLVEFHPAKKREKFGRALGDIVTVDGSLREALISRGYGRPYDGGKREGWC